MPNVQTDRFKGFTFKNLNGLNIFQVTGISAI